MMYIKDQHGNEIELNPTFKFVGLPFQREYNSMTKSGLDGEIITSKPIVHSVNRSITGQLYGSTKEEVLTKRNELADLCSLGEIRVGYSEEGWYIKGQVTSFDHKYIERSARYVADVSITIKCDNPYQKADEIVEELIITPSDYPTRIEPENPHPAANVKLGTFDPTTGVKISDENSWEGYSWYISSLQIGNGFSFLSFADFTLMVYQDSVSRKMKIFADGEIVKEVDLAGESGFVPVEVNFGTRKAREITVVHTEGFMSVDCIIPIPANLPVVANPGTVEDYPVLEIESTDTEALFSPLGKKTGDITHAFRRNFVVTTDPMGLTPESGTETADIWYPVLYFLNGQALKLSGVPAKHYACVILRWDLKALQSAYTSMTATEIKDHMQSILSELWGYAEGTINVGDPSFEASLNGFGASNGVTVSQSTDWAKTGVNSLKMVLSGSSEWAQAVKSYGDQHGKKIKAKATFYDPVGGAKVALQWQDATNAEFIAGSASYTMSAGEEKTIELEVVVPENCTEIRLYVRPSYGVAEARTVYVDDVTVTANGIEMRVWTDGSHWSSGCVTHEADFSSPLDWLLDGDDTPSRFVDVNGEIYFLIMSQYPSDGISSSAVYIDHCRLGTTMNYAKLGADAITNYGGNLLENGWAEYYGTAGYGQVSSPINQTLFDHQGEKLVYPGQKVTISYEGWRDAEAAKNGIRPELLILHYLKDGTYISFTATMGLFKDLEPNQWERRTDPTYIKNEPDLGTIKAYCYRAPSTTLSGRIGIRNAVLVAGDKIIKIQPQELFIIGFSQDVVLIKGNMLSINPKARGINKEGTSLYPLINQDFKFSPLQVLGGLNHFRINHTGANLKIRTKYQPKWR